jgi:predicted enzyme related to lactoylglutathione lyase
MHALADECGERTGKSGQFTGNRQQSKREGRVMHIKFAMLPVFDQQRAKDFYVRGLGCHVAVEKPYREDGYKWIELSFTGSETRLLLEKREDQTTSSAPVLVLIDPDLSQTIASLTDRGVEILSEPHEASWEPGQRLAEFRDSEGNRIVLTSS